MTSTRGVARINSFEIVFEHILIHINRFLIVQELKVYLHKRGLPGRPKKKCNGVKSYGLGGQLISPRREIIRPRNISWNKAIFARVVGHMVPSCWNHIFSKTYSWIAEKKCLLSYDRIDGDSCSIIVFESHFQTKSAPLTECNGISSITWGIWGHQI